MYLPDSRQDLLKFSDILDKVDKEDGKILKYLMAIKIETKSELLNLPDKFRTLVDEYVKEIVSLLGIFATLYPTNTILKYQKYYNETTTDQFIKDVISGNINIPIFSQLVSNITYEIFQRLEMIDKISINKCNEIIQFNKDYHHYLSKLEEIEGKYLEFL